MNSMPAFITANQAQQIVSAGTGAINQANLYKNPLTNTIQTIWNNANNIESKLCEIFWNAFVKG